MLNKLVYSSVLVVCCAAFLMSVSEHGRGVEAKSRFLKKLEKRSDVDLGTEWEDVRILKTTQNPLNCFNECLIFCCLFMLKSLNCSKEYWQSWRKWTSWKLWEQLTRRAFSTTTHPTRICRNCRRRTSDDFIGLYSSDCPTRDPTKVRSIPRTKAIYHYQLQSSTKTHIQLIQYYLNIKYIYLFFSLFLFCLFVSFLTKKFYLNIFFSFFFVIVVVSNLNESQYFMK